MAGISDVKTSGVIFITEAEEIFLHIELPTDGESPMGMQQLLIVIVVVIVVGIAIAVGLTMFTDDSISANRDAITSDLASLALRAQQFYKRPGSIGGGDGSFVRLTADAAGIALLTNKPANSNGAYSIQTAGTNTQVVLKGVGKEKADGVHPVEVWMTVTPTTTTPEIKY